MWDNTICVEISALQNNYTALKYTAFKYSNGWMQFETQFIY